MKAIESILPRNFPIREHGETTCEVCNHTYTLYETTKGITGACKNCLDRQLYEGLKVRPKKERDKRREQRFITSFERVTEDVKVATVSSYTPKHATQVVAKKAAIQYVTTFDGVQSLLFSGSCGLGKSHLSYAIAKAIRKNDYRVLYLKTTDLFDHIKQTYQPGAKITERQIFDMIERLDLLILDDIGSEYVKANEYGHESWASDVLYKIFDMRLNKSLICSTNYSEKMLTEKYGHHGERIIDRMMDVTKAIRIEGESYRRKGRL